MIKHITDAASPELAPYALSSEAKLKHIYEPEPGLFVVESPNVVLRALRAGYEPVSFLMEPRFAAPIGEAQTGDNNVWASVEEVLKRAGDAPIYTGELDLISRVCGFKQSRGFLATLRRKPLPAPEAVLQSARRVAVLEDVENPTNVGAIFRSAAALGMDAVLLTCGCTDPLYRRASRVSMGGVFQIPWTFVGHDCQSGSAACLQTLKDAGFSVAAMALSDRAVGLNDAGLCGEEKLAILLGNEQNGLLPETQAACDYLVQIPMQHEMDSLNVAATGAVVFWQLGSSNSQMPEKEGQAQ